MSARIRLTTDAATLPRLPMHGAGLSLGGSTHNKTLMIETFLNKHFDAELEPNFPTPNSTSAPEGNGYVACTPPCRPLAHKCTLSTHHPPGLRKHFPHKLVCLSVTLGCLAVLCPCR